jgi:hypothetical protein
MRFCYLISTRPTVTVIVRRLVGSLTLPSGFDLDLQFRDLVLELCNLRLSSLELRSKLGIGGGQGGYSSAIRCCCCCLLGYGVDGVLHRLFSSVFNHHIGTVEA